MACKEEKKSVAVKEHMLRSEISYALAVQCEGNQLADERGIKRGEEALVKAYHGECFLTSRDLLCRDLLRLLTCSIRSSISCGISCRTERVVACRRSHL